MLVYSRCLRTHHNVSLWENREVFGLIPKVTATTRVIWEGHLTFLSLDSLISKMKGIIFTSQNYRDDFLRKSDEKKK